MTINGTTNI